MRMLIVILFLLLYSCKKELPDRKELIGRYYEEYVSQMRQEKREECEEEVLEEAQAQIDSLIDTWVNAELFDTIRFPGKPAKPVKPDDIFDEFQRFPLDSITLDSTLN